MSAARLYYLLEMQAISFDTMDDEVMEALGIQNPSPDHPEWGLTRHRQYRDWEECLENLFQHCERVEEIDEEGWGIAQETFMGCCNVCRGNCKPREQGKGLWEL